MLAWGLVRNPLSFYTRSYSVGSAGRPYNLGVRGRGNRHPGQSTHGTPYRLPRPWSSLACNCKNSASDATSQLRTGGMRPYSPAYSDLIPLKCVRIIHFTESPLLAIRVRTRWHLQMSEG